MSALRRVLALSSCVFAAACGVGEAGELPVIGDEFATAEQGLEQTAIYDAARRAPACNASVAICNSGTLLSGRAQLGPEANAPNTIGSTCADGTGGSFHSDESLDALKISTVDLTDLAGGKTVRVDATVWAYSTTNALDIYTSPDGSSTWTLAATVQATRSGAQVLSATFVLPSGPAPLRAIRGQFRYGAGSGPCTAGTFNERDDLIFAVGPSVPPVDAGTDAGIDAGVDAGAPFDGGLIINPSFEQTFAGWQITGSASIVSGGHSGVRALALNNNLANARQQAFLGGVTGTAVLRLWYRNPTGVGGVNVRVDNLTGGNPTSVTCGTSIPATSWTEFVCDITQLSGSMVAVNLSAPTSAQIDDVSLFAVGIPDGPFNLTGEAFVAQTLANGDFEQYFQEWTSTDPYPWISSSARTGMNAGVITSGFSPMPEPGDAVLSHPLAPSSAFTVTGYFKLLYPANNSTLTLKVVEANGSSSGCGSTPGSDTAWTKVSCTFFGSADPRTLQLTAYTDNGQRVLLDDFAIEPLANSSFEYGLTGFLATANASIDATPGTSLDGAVNAVLRPRAYLPAGISVTFIRRAGMNSIGLAYKWESACQACANSTLTATLAPPGANTVPFATSQLSAVNRVGWWSTGLSLANVPVNVPVTLTVKAASVVPAGTTTEFFRIDRLQLY